MSVVIDDAPSHERARRPKRGAGAVHDFVGPPPPRCGRRAGWRDDLTTATNPTADHGDQRARVKGAQRSGIPYATREFVPP